MAESMGCIFLMGSTISIITRENKQGKSMELKLRTSSKAEGKVLWNWNVPEDTRGRVGVAF